MSFIRNTWYAAAWGEEIGRSLLPRTLLEEPLVFFRREDGTVAAMQDRCPHRIVPLSMGRLIGDDVECLYHGMRFNSQGRCVANPNGTGIIPPAARVQSYRVEERHNVVWIWMGDQNLADPGQIPDLHWMVEPDRYAETHGATKLPAGYMLVVDNLMDLRHVVFLHQGLEPREHALAPIRDSEDDEGRVWSRITRDACNPPSFFATRMQGKVDHWQEILCYPPGSLVIFYGVTDPGKPREEGLETFNISLVTPETTKSSHYLWASARNFDLEDAALTAGLNEASRHAFAFEDAPVLEAQQRLIGDGDLMDFNPVLISNDVAAARVRRIVKRRLEQERGATLAKTA